MLKKNSIVFIYKIKFQFTFLADVGAGGGAFFAPPGGGGGCGN
jgi:hypothetical protein